MLLHFLGVAVATAAAAGSRFDPPYDHQTKTYLANEKPYHYNTSSGGTRAAAFFTPEHGADTLTWFIGNATQTINLGTPGFTSWIGCTTYENTTCVGCSADKQRGETFPVFGALLNALHRGVKINILTNDYGIVECPGLISPLSFLSLNGANVRFYTSTTFMHAKQIIVDGNKLSLSSINFSENSVTRNREAGLLIEGNDGGAAAMVNAVFRRDFESGTQLKVQRYNSSTYAKITRKDKVPTRMPYVNLSSPRFVSDPPVLKDLAPSEIEVVASPDYARVNLWEHLDAVEKTFHLHIYQVTDPGMCAKIVSLAKRGVTTKVMASSRIYDKFDCFQAIDCYKNLTAAGVNVRLTPYYYVYSHQKYWVGDGKTVAISTGNWSPNDYPLALAGDRGSRGEPDSFPAFPASDWVNTNRDFTVFVKNTAFVQDFMDVFEGDYTQGSDYGSGRDGYLYCESAKIPSRRMPL